MKLLCKKIDNTVLQILQDDEQVIFHELCTQTPYCVLGDIKESELDIVSYQGEMPVGWNNIPGSGSSYSFTNGSFTLL